MGASLELPSPPPSLPASFALTLALGTTSVVPSDPLALFGLCVGAADLPTLSP